MNADPYGPAHPLDPLGLVDSTDPAAGPTKFADPADPAVRAEQQRAALRVGLERTDLSLESLWLRYIALGGEAGLLEIEAYLHQLMSLPRLQSDVLAHALNEYLMEFREELQVPYAQLPAPPIAGPQRSVTPRGARGALGPVHAPLAATRGPLAAAVALLQGVVQAPPEGLLGAIEAAGSALGVRFTLHLIDYAQHHLIPVVPDPGDPAKILVGTPVAVEATLAGQAFQRVQTVTSDSTISRRGKDRARARGAGDEARWWMPLLDGNERLGVLQVDLSEQAGLDDAQLRQDCEWICRLIGHMLIIVTQSGDVFDSLRRSKPRTPAAELIWDLLPPLTVATDRVLIAGQFEPSHGVGGDAFDYAVSDTHAHLAIFDATGHSVASGLVIAAALAASRSVRRAGGGLFEQAQAVEDVVREQFADRGLLLTGVLAELNLSTGRLRYLVAGHPEPLVLREGKIVKALTAGRRALFGIDEIAVTIGQENLQPGDCLVLYTDGVTEARDADGIFFGLQRLQTFVQRSAAAAYPPPETVRRLLRAVLQHQHGHLQDDATVLLTTWTPHPVTRRLDFDAIAAGA